MILKILKYFINLNAKNVFLILRICTMIILYIFFNVEISNKLTWTLLNIVNFNILIKQRLFNDQWLIYIKNLLLIKNTIKSILIIYWLYIFRTLIIYTILNLIVLFIIVCHLLIYIWFQNWSHEILSCFTKIFFIIPF